MQVLGRNIWMLSGHKMANEIRQLTIKMFTMHSISETVKDSILIYIWRGDIFKFLP